MRRGGWRRRTPKGPASSCGRTWPIGIRRRRRKRRKGSREFAGAKFHKDVAGNANRETVLDAVMRGLPNGNAAADRASEILEIMQATGRRKQVGSATAFNQEMLDTLGGPMSPAALGTRLVKSLGTLVTGASDAVRRSALRGNIETLADMFIDPQTVDLIYEAMQRGARPSLTEAAGRSALQSGGTLYDPRGARALAWRP